MVKQFRRLPPEEYEKHGIYPPQEFDGEIAWYVHPPDYDPHRLHWLALAFLHPAEHPGVLVLHLCRYDDDMLGDAYADGIPFDTLNWSIGAGFFTREMLDEFTALLRQHGERLADAPGKRPAMFESIKEADLRPKWNYRFTPLFPDAGKTHAYYHQAYDPLASDPPASATLVHLAGSQSSENMSCSLHHFPLSALQDQVYDIDSHSIGRINLDRRGVDEFIGLLEATWRAPGGESLARLSRAKSPAINSVGMERLLFFPEARIDLAWIERVAKQMGYWCRYLLLGMVDNYMLVYYQGCDVWKWSALRRTDKDGFYDLTPAQRERVAALGFSTGFVVEYRARSWSQLLPFLQLLLEHYGGRMGCPDGTLQRLYTAQDVEQVEHSFRRYEQASALPASKPGDRIVLDPAIPQPENVFDLVTYRSLLVQAQHMRTQLGILHEQFCQLMEEYRRRLPIHLVAQCPYCGIHILLPVDSFSLMGFDGNLNATKAYGGELQWQPPPPAQRCPHALCATVSVNLNGLEPDDVAGWVLGDKLKHRGSAMISVPKVMVWPLVARYTSAVVHALPVGRLDDEQPVHRYTAYFSTYFCGDESNLHTKEMWGGNDMGGPGIGATQSDIDLLKWVKAGRLYWLDPEDTSRLVQGPPEVFPYADVQPQGWYYVLPDGQLDGPNPFYKLWQGQPPPHDESFSKSIERLKT